MAVNENTAFEYVRLNPHKSEPEIAQALFGPGAPQQRINPIMRSLAANGLVIRDKSSGVYRYTVAAGDMQIPQPAFPRMSAQDIEGLTEDQIKDVLRDWLKTQGYSVQIAMGNERGIDIDALRDRERWIIEVKGPGSRQPMRVNYFISMLGEVLQRMSDPNARYSVALPDLPQYRRLWHRLPMLAKHRTGISAIFVATDGTVHTCD